jgi:hypothetical protein
MIRKSWARHDAVTVLSWPAPPEVIDDVVPAGRGTRMVIRRAIGEPAGRGF